jgi:hypothetical protein
MSKLTFCLHCRKDTGNKSIKIITTSNGRKMQKSICTVCGGKKSIFVSSKKKLK